MTLCEFMRKICCIGKYMHTSDSANVEQITISQHTTSSSHANAAYDYDSDEFSEMSLHDVHVEDIEHIYANEQAHSIEDSVNMNQLPTTQIQHVNIECIEVFIPVIESSGTTIIVHPGGILTTDEMSEATWYYDIAKQLYAQCEESVQALHMIELQEVAKAIYLERRISRKQSTDSNIRGISRIKDINDIITINRHLSEYVNTHAFFMYASEEQHTYKDHVVAVQAHSSQHDRLQLGFSARLMPNLPYITFIHTQLLSSDSSEYCVRSYSCKHVKVPYIHSDRDLTMHPVELEIASITECTLLHSTLCSELTHTYMQLTKYMATYNVRNGKNITQYLAEYIKLFDDTLHRLLQLQVISLKGVFQLDCQQCELHTTHRSVGYGELLEDVQRYFRLFEPLFYTCNFTNQVNMIVNNIDRQYVMRTQEHDNNISNDHLVADATMFQQLTQKLYEYIVDAPLLELAPYDSPDHDYFLGSVATMLYSVEDIIALKAMLHNARSVFAFSKDLFSRITHDVQLQNILENVRRTKVLHGMEVYEVLQTRRAQKAQKLLIQQRSTLFTLKEQAEEEQAEEEQ